MYINCGSPKGSQFLATIGLAIIGSAIVLLANPMGPFHECDGRSLPGSSAVVVYLTRDGSGEKILLYLSLFLLPAGTFKWREYPYDHNLISLIR